MNDPRTPEALFDRARSLDSARPLITYYDDATGERAELSAASLGNWIAKTHFLLLEELGLGRGDRAYVDVPTHWLALVVHFGVWSAGLEVVTEPGGADVAFVGVDQIASAAGIDEVYALALAPWGQGFTGSAPAGTTDFVAAVRPQADAWASVRSSGTPKDPALDGRSRADLVDAASARAAALQLTPSARVLVGESAAGGLDLIDALAPLTVGGTLVLLRNAPATGQDRRIAQENVTHVAVA